MASDEGDTLTIQASDFQRLQTQLIELRTTNYQLKEEQQRLVSEIGQLNDGVQTKGRELEKANKALQRSKKAKEMSSLLEENDSLQQKLQSQETDFNLQSRTLMEELSRVCEENDRLKAQAKRGGEGEGGGGGGGGGGEGDEMTRLKAENTALQKMLQEKFSNAHDTVEGSEDGEPASSGVTPAVMELQLELNTEKEQKTLLQKKLEEVQASARREQNQLQSQLDMWADKAKKKQDSFVQLQEEKERLFNESRATFDEMVRTKDHEIQSLQEQVQKLKKELENKDEMSMVGVEIAKQLETLSTEKEELSERCATIIQEEEVLCGERDELKALTEELGKELHESKAVLGEQKTEAEYLNTQLEEARMSQEQLADQVARASEERQMMEKKLEAAEKLAEKRKTLVDEMSIREHESAEERRRKMEAVQDKLRGEVEKLERQLHEERAEVHRLSVANDEIPELRKRLRGLEERQEIHSSTVARVEATIEEERERYESKLQEVTSQHESERESLQSELSSLQGEMEGERERVRELEMKVEDKEEQVRIVEKKSNSLLKDLKRQLHQMQKREEKRQEQLADMAGMDHYIGPHADLSSDNISKHSRESSLSSIRGHLPHESSISSPASTPAGPSTTGPLLGGGAAVNEETRELLSRVTDLQREKWELEERVNHLETTGSALAKDVMQKSQIIKSYFMENKADHTPPRRKVADKMSPMRLLGAMNKEDMLNEINRKMQRALEEALTKNIHLQENVMMLTAELQKYSDKKLPVSVEDSQSHAEASNTRQDTASASPDDDHTTVT